VSDAVDEHSPNDELRRRIEELERELKALQRHLSLVLDQAGGGALLLQEAQAALQASEERYQNIATTSDEGIWMVDANRVTTFANERLASLLGYTVEEMIGRPAEDFEDASDREVARQAFERHRQGTRERRNMALRRKDGTILWASVAASPLIDADGRFAGSLGMFMDITERRQAEEVRARLATIVECSEDAIFAMSLDGTILSWNAGAKAQYGYTPEEVIGQSVELLVPPEGRAELFDSLDRLKAGKAVFLETVRRRKDGTKVVVALSMSPIRGVDGRVIGASTIARDVTERRSLEEQFRQSQKMEAVGRLAGGVAHDFNNLLTVILGYSDLFANREPECAEIQEIRRAGEQAAALTRQLLAFSRKQVLELVVLCPNDVIRNIEGMLRRLIGEDLDFVTRLDPSVCNVRVDPGQLEQVVMNLAVNARDAMPGGGKLTIETANVDLDEAYAQRHASVAPGPYVMLAVSDTGVGMDAETQARIFEPFFTTKEKGKGTGLGLSTVHGIVHQSGGNIWVYSEPGRGTTFKIYFPRIAGAAATPQIPSRTVPAVEDSGNGSRTILLVEDEEPLRRLVKRILELSRHTVLEARSPADALRIAREHDGPIHLLLTDVVMPGMSGPELAASLQRERPSVPVLYMSGYTDNTIAHHGILGAGTHFIQKPFTLQGLVQRVREVMATRS